MKQQTKYQIPLFWRLTGWIMLYLFFLMAIGTGVTLHYTLVTFQEKIDGILMSTVESLAKAAPIRNIIRNGVCHQDMADYLTTVVDSTEDLDYITLADENSIRVFFIDPAYIGKPFEGGDQHRALAGEIYFSDATPGNFEGQRRAFHPVFDDDGTVLGFVMASTTHERIQTLRMDILETYFWIFVALTLSAMFFCSILAVYLGRHLRGMKPEDVLRMYLTQNDILNGLDEGLISFDTGGRVRLVNAAAARMLGQREDLLVGQQVDDLIRTADGDSLREFAEGTVHSSRPNILVRPIHLPDSSLWARRVLILGDKTDAMRHMEELAGTRHMVNALRANTHEFLNKLQVISGLLQMGRVEEAMAYIGDFSSHYEQIIGPVMKYIRNSNVAALILGKAHNMRELDIHLYLLNNSRLPEQSRYVGTEELVTVVGNLLENALEAVNGVPADAVRSVALQITEDDKGLLIMVSDTGPGIPEDVLPHIFKAGFSTKAGTGRGVGLKLINDIVSRHGGTIDVDTDPGSGTTISIIFSRERGGSL